MTTLCVLGAGGHAIVVAESAALSGAWSSIELVDKVEPASTQLLDWKVRKEQPLKTECATPGREFVVAIGNNRQRLQLLRAISELGGSIATVVHPAAFVSRHASIARGTVVLAQAVINARADIAEGCIINSAAVVEHDCRLAAGVHISPGAQVAGKVFIGECTWVGIGASVREEVTVGANSVIGAAAAVVVDVGDNEVVTGVPARPRVS